MQVKEKLLEFLKILIIGIIDCFERCIQSMTFAVGWRMVKVLGLAFIMLLVSLLCQSFDLWVITSWQENLSCICIALFLCLFDFSNMRKFKDLRSKLKGVVGNVTRE